MNRLLAFLVAILLVVDILTLTTVQEGRRRPVPPDLAPRVAQLEKDLARAQQEIGELKQEMALVARHGQPAD